jgi:hypothetical protein
MSDRHDLTIEQGATMKITFTYKDTLGNGMIVSGSTAKMQIRTAQDVSSSSLYDCTSKLNVASVNSTITLEIPSSDTKNLNFTTGYYDLYLISTTGFVKRLAQGKVTLDKGVTNV